MKLIIINAGAEFIFMLPAKFINAQRAAGAADWRLIVQYHRQFHRDKDFTCLQCNPTQAGEDGCDWSAGQSALMRVALGGHTNINLTETQRKSEELNAYLQANSILCFRSKAGLRTARLQDVFRLRPVKAK
jgi:hypothetical protein